MTPPRIYDDTVRALITALAQELPAARHLPLLRPSFCDIRREASQEFGLFLSRSTIITWLSQAANRGWAYTSRVTSRDLHFEQKAAPFWAFTTKCGTEKTSLAAMLSFVPTYSRGGSDSSSTDLDVMVLLSSRYRNRRGGLPRRTDLRACTMRTCSGIQRARSSSRADRERYRALVRVSLGRTPRSRCS